MLRRFLTFYVSVPVAALSSFGCFSSNVDPDGTDDDLVSEVATKTVDIAQQVGGDTGYGGPLMVGYFDHMPVGMGFQFSANLASPDGFVRLQLHNQATQACPFRMSYVAGYLGLTDQSEVIDVPAGETVNVDLPCAEIIGVGPLATPGGVGCVLADGTEIPNTMAVPGFLGQDFTCGALYHCHLTADVDVGDGDTRELIVQTQAMVSHMMNGGPMGHFHGMGSGMMGPHWLPRA